MQNSSPTPVQDTPASDPTSPTSTATPTLYGPDRCRKPAEVNRPLNPEAPRHAPPTYNKARTEGVQNNAFSVHNTVPPLKNQDVQLYQVNGGYTLSTGRIEQVPNKSSIHHKDINGNIRGSTETHTNRHRSTTYQSEYKPPSAQYNGPSNPQTCSYAGRARDTRSQTPNMFCKRSRAAREGDYDDVPPPRPAPPVLPQAEVQPPWTQSDYNIKPLLPTLVINQQPARPDRRREVKKTLVIKAQANSRSSSLPPWSRRSVAPPPRGHTSQENCESSGKPGWARDRIGSPARTPPSSPSLGYRSRTPWVNSQAGNTSFLAHNHFINRKVTA